MGARRISRHTPRGPRSLCCVCRQRSCSTFRTRIRPSGLERFSSESRAMTPQQLITHYAASSNKQGGFIWYPEAHAIVAELARDAGLSRDRTAAIVSLASPGIRWSQCLDESRALLNGTGSLSTYPIHRERALAVLNGADPYLLPWGMKTYAFWRNLLRPATSREVTLDRWHARLHDVRRWTPKRYAHAESVYQEAARRLNLLPHQLQATLWLDLVNPAETPF